MIKTMSNGVKIINVTPHPITFLDGTEVVSVPTSGIIINAKVEEQVVRKGTPTLVTTTFSGSEESEKALAELERQYPDALIVGSIIAAQAYPGRVVAMCPAPGFERVPPQEKRMSVEKFTTF